jgi:hypothetical protein
LIIAPVVEVKSKKAGLGQTRNISVNQKHQWHTNVVEKIG